MRPRPTSTLICPNCDIPFKKGDHHVLSETKKFPDKKFFCSRKCKSLFNNTKIVFSCAQCQTEIIRQKCQTGKSKKLFCNHSCATTFNNQNKTHGTRRSKLEVFLETELSSIYPDLDIHFNRKDTINSELDIYIPSLKLAFELNGIFHYEPIYGPEKLSQIQNNDTRKFQACLERGIELCIIDTSYIKKFSSKKGSTIFDIITNLVNSKLSSIPDYVEVL